MREYSNSFFLKSLTILFCIGVIVFLIVSYSPLAEAYPNHKGSTFRKEQLGFSRVRVAYQLKWKGICSRLKQLHVDSNQFELFIRAFKREKIVEAWVKSTTGKQWQLYATYPICASSGDLGPKRCQGDNQVPEGFYRINLFNPSSAYHLSLGVNYPNELDRLLACKSDPGGQIMIHGNCVTIGCIPLTDDKIRELYVLAVEARDGGQTMSPIHIFPSRLTDQNLASLKKQYPDSKLQQFWGNLKKGYDTFEQSKQLPQIRIDKENKRYTIK